MAKKKPFDLIYDPGVEQHLQSIEKKQLSLIRAAIHEQLQFEPETETRNRKPLQQPAAFGATCRPGQSVPRTVCCEPGAPGSGDISG
jgi:hypothetical protein